MLKSLKLRNFTAFAAADFEFADGLNLFVGENGTGKTHVLKATYSTAYVCARGSKDSISGSPTKSFLQSAIAGKLKAVLKPDEIGRLARRDRRGRQRCEVSCNFVPAKHNIAFTLNTASKSEVTIDKLPSAWLDRLPVFLPTRELLTIYPGFVSLYETTSLPFEETWRDICLLLGAPLARGPRERHIRDLLAPLESAMGGKVEMDSSGRFYLNVNGVNMEMHLVAEGLRKLAMLARLIATGALADKGFLFWDEPEANLNPRMIKIVAKTIFHLCQSGIQVFIATHSLFLIREIDILLAETQFSGTATHFFGLHRGENGVDVRQGPTADDIGDIASLQEELSQSDRYLAKESSGANN